MGSNLSGSHHLPLRTFRRGVLKLYVKILIFWATLVKHGRGTLLAVTILWRRYRVSMVADRNMMYIADLLLTRYLTIWKILSIWLHTIKSLPVTIDKDANNSGPYWVIAWSRVRFLQSCLVWSNLLI